MSILKIKIETPNEMVDEAMWIQVFDMSGDKAKTSELLLDSKEKTQTKICVGDKIKIECNITRDDAYEFSILKVNDKIIRSGEIITVEGDIEIFAKSVYIDYKLYINCDEVKVIRNGEKLNNEAILRYYDVLKISFNQETTINRKLYQASTVNIEVHGDVTIKRNII